MEMYMCMYASCILIQIIFRTCVVGYSLEIAQAQDKDIVILWSTVSITDTLTFCKLNSAI